MIKCVCVPFLFTRTRQTLRKFFMLHRSKNATFMNFTHDSRKKMYWSSHIFHWSSYFFIGRGQRTGKFRSLPYEHLINNTSCEHFYQHQLLWWYTWNTFLTPPMSKKCLKQWKITEIIMSLVHNWWNSKRTWPVKNMGGPRFLYVIMFEILKSCKKIAFSVRLSMKSFRSISSSQSKCCNFTKAHEIHP